MSIEKYEFDTMYFTSRAVTMPSPASKNEIVLYEMVMTNRIKRSTGKEWCALFTDNEVVKSIARKRHQIEGFKVYYGSPRSNAWNDLTGIGTLIEELADRDKTKGIKNAMFIVLGPHYDYLSLNVPKGTMVVISSAPGKDAKIAFDNKVSGCFGAEALLTENMHFTSQCVRKVAIADFFGDKTYPIASGASIEASCAYPGFGTFTISRNEKEYVLCIKE